MSVIYLDKRNIVIRLVTLAAMFTLGLVIGYYGRKTDPNILPKADSLLRDNGNQDQFVNEKNLIAQTLEDVNSDNLRSYLQRLTREPHIAGSRQDEELVEYIKNAWIDMGLDRVELAEYDFYLSWPNQVNESKSTLFELLLISFLSRPIRIKST